MSDRDKDITLNDVQNALNVLKRASVKMGKNTVIKMVMDHLGL